MPDVVDKARHGVEHALHRLQERMAPFDRQWGDWKPDPTWSDAADS
jgi:hypothetical protein